MNEKVTQRVTIFTDGACIGNPGPGGYAAILLQGNQRKEVSSGYKCTTNNRMELMAAIAGLEQLKDPSEVLLYSDSKYLVDSIMSGAVKRWRNNGWKRNKRDVALNSDLWQKLLDLSETHSVTFEWVKGHSGNPENERCDYLSNREARKSGLPPDSGYENKALSDLPLFG